jgi:chromosome segregation ATPase
MNLNTLLDKIAGRHQQRQQARKADFRSLVAQVADGKEPDADEVDRILRDNGKTLDDLRAGVEVLLKRRALRQALDQKPKLAKERERIEREIEDANRQLEEAETRHNDVTNPLFARLEEIKHGMNETIRAAQELERTCDDEGLLAERQAVWMQLKELNTRRSRSEMEINNLRSGAKSDRQETQYVPKSRAEEYAARADRRDARAQELEAELPDLRRQISDAEAREKAIRDRMLEP